MKPLCVACSAKLVYTNRYTNPPRTVANNEDNLAGHSLDLQEILSN